MAQIAGMRERTVIVNSLSKLFRSRAGGSVTSSRRRTFRARFRKVHDFLTVGAANPLQHAGAYALSLPESYYIELQNEYRRKRDYIVPVLQNAGLKCAPPQGAFT
jgi:aminotransferase